MSADPSDDTTCARFSLGGATPEPEREDAPADPFEFGGRYEIGRPLGRGGTSRVYRAYDRRLRRDVAVKVFDRDAVAVEQTRRMREIAIHGALDHPAIVPLYDCGTEDGWTYLVVGFVDGPNLAERLLSGPLTAGEVTELADRLAGALAHVHAEGVTHRDLKPANILLGPDGAVIADFGIAHTFDATRITRTGTAPGTAAYMAPEQVSGDPAGPPADIYALGLVLLECLTGEREYPGTMAESAVVRLTRPPRIPDTLPLANVLARMTQRDPLDRPTAADVQEMVREPELVTPPPAVPLPRRPARTRHALAAAGLTAAAGAIVLPLLLSGPAAVDGTAPQPSPTDPPRITGTPTPAPMSTSDVVRAGQQMPPKASDTPTQTSGSPAGTTTSETPSKTTEPTSEPATDTTTRPGRTTGKPSKTRTPPPTP